jgi:muramoyltetrapeptide carboxypeptidase
MLSPYLQKGDTIAIAATARKVSLAEMQPAISVFESWGLKVLLHPNLFEADNQFAGNDDVRAKVFQELLDNANVKAIICARGGYGTVRIIDKLDFTRFPKSPKWIIGYSDITVLHSHIFTHHRVATMHATMPINMQAHNANAQTIESLHKVLFGENDSYTFSSHSLNKPGEATGKLIGGNLSVLYSLLGSNSDIDTSNCILFLEDLDEYLYHIDRMMMNLKRNGKLKDLAGIVVGDMSDMKDNPIPFGKTALEIITEHVAEYNYPVAFGFGAGHDSLNVAMVFGETYQLNSSCSGACLLQRI